MPPATRRVVEVMLVTFGPQVLASSSLRKTKFPTTFSCQRENLGTTRAISKRFRFSVHFSQAQCVSERQGKRYWWIRFDFSKFRSWADNMTIFRSCALRPIFKFLRLPIQILLRNFWVSEHYPSILLPLSYKRIVRSLFFSKSPFLELPTDISHQVFCHFGNHALSVKIVRRVLRSWPLVGFAGFNPLSVLRFSFDQKDAYRSDPQFSSPWVFPYFPSDTHTTFAVDEKDVIVPIYWIALALPPHLNKMLTLSGRFLAIGVRLHLPRSRIDADITNFVMALPDSVFKSTPTASFPETTQRIASFQFESTDNRYSHKAAEISLALTMSQHRMVSSPLQSSPTEFATRKSSFRANFFSFPSLLRFRHPVSHAYDPFSGNIALSHPALRSACFPASCIHLRSFAHPSCFPAHRLRCACWLSRIRCASSLSWIQFSIHSDFHPDTTARMSSFRLEFSASFPYL